MARLTKDNLFKPPLSRMEAKNKTTDEISRAITQDESVQRHRKTERLKALRLEKEAQEKERAPDVTAKSATSSRRNRKKA